MPTIDLGAAEASSAIDEACRSVGFFAVTGHGVPMEVVQAAWDASRRFFDLPLETKMTSRRPDNPYGYEPIATEALGRTLDSGADELPDPKQTFNIGPPKRGPDSVLGEVERMWPTEPYDLRISWLSYYVEMERLADSLMSLFAVAMGRPANHFALHTNNHLAALRAIDYPEPEPGDVVVRAGAHTDYGTLTILRPDPVVGGLEVADESGNWLEVPKVDGGFVVNIGDLMHRWTNGRWRSTLHRVVGDAEGRRRASMAFFHNPNWDAIIDPILLTPEETPLFEPIEAGPWLATKFARSTT